MIPYWWFESITKDCTSASGSRVATIIIGQDNLQAVVVRTARLYIDYVPFLDTRDRGFYVGLSLKTNNRVEPYLTR